MVNKFEGDAVLAVFGAPVSLPSPDDDALAAARAIASRLCDKVPELQAGIGVAAGTVVARPSGRGRGNAEQGQQRRSGPMGFG